MRSTRGVSLLLLPSLLLSLSPANAKATPRHEALHGEEFVARHAAEARRAAASKKEKTGGIREVVPDKYRARYREWKREFLSTATGRAQWGSFEKNDRLTLTVVVTRDNARGAGTGQYRWDGEGRLVEATIVLGSSLHEGYPNPIYYPVMNSLTARETADASGGHTLAAAKIAHEFGHLTRTAEMDHELYELQNRLMPVYNEILLSNGRDTRDPRLVELAARMGGTPVEVWEDREYWGEANAMLFLRDRFAGQELGCTLFTRIRQSVNLYASNYADRFLKVARGEPSLDRCGWR